MRRSQFSITILKRSPTWRLGSKRKAQRGPQVLVYFSFYQRILLGTLFWRTATCLVDSISDQTCGSELNRMEEAYAFSLQSLFAEWHFIQRAGLHMCGTSRHWNLAFMYFFRFTWNGSEELDWEPCTNMIVIPANVRKYTTYTTISYISMGINWWLEVPTQCPLTSKFWVVTYSRRLEVHSQRKYWAFVDL